ncbi:hypothetical protein D3C87_1635690 [compost metagenome]
MQVIEGFLGFLVEPLALGGQLQPGVFATEEFEPGCLLQKPDRLADGRLADIQFFRSTGKALPPGGGFENEEVVGGGNERAESMHKLRLCPRIVFSKITSAAAVCKLLKIPHKGTSSCKLMLGP